MTLNDIIVSALAQLDRGHDAQTLDIWRDKFTRFANDGVTDLAEAYQPRATEAYESADGLLDTLSLSRPCVKLLSVTRSGKAEVFTPGPRSGTVLLPGGPAGAGGIPLPARPHAGPLRCAGPARMVPRPDRMLRGRPGASRWRRIPSAGRQHLLPNVRGGQSNLRPHVGEADSYCLLNRW